MIYEVEFQDSFLRVFFLVKTVYSDICQDLHWNLFVHRRLILLEQKRCPVKFPTKSERILPHCAFRSVFYACVVKGDFFLPLFHVPAWLAHSGFLFAFSP
jgi:hypothetical protein